MITGIGNGDRYRGFIGATFLEVQSQRKLKHSSAEQFSPLDFLFKLSEILRGDLQINRPS